MAATRGCPCLSSLKTRLYGRHTRKISDLTAQRRRYDVAVVGGGVMGSSSAYFLASRMPGQSVCVIERDTTYKKASSMLSLASIRQQFSCPENIEMSLYSSQFLKTIPQHLSVEGEELADVGFVEGGYLLLASEAGESIMRENNALQRSLGASIELLSPSQLSNKFPWISTEGIALASFGFRGEGWFDPWLLLSGFKKKAISLGVDFIPREVMSINITSNKVKSVKVKSSSDDITEIECDYLINAGGPWAADVALMAGIGKNNHTSAVMRTALPVEPRLRCAFVVKCPVGPSNSPLVVDGNIFWRQESNKTYITGSSPPEHLDKAADGVNLEVDYSLFDDIIWPSLANRVPAFETLKVQGGWAGFYEYNTLDQNSIIGAHPVINNFIFANGFSGHGIQQSPAVGRAVSEIILDGRSHSIDLARLSFQRVIADKPYDEKLVV